MSNYTIVIIVAVAIVVLALVGVLATSRRRDADSAIGALSRETRKRDRSTAPGTAPVVPTGRDYERSVALARSGGGRWIRRQPIRSRVSTRMVMPSDLWLPM